jgi:RNA-binding motif X-linked protein 2
MNSVRAIQQLNKRELEAGINPEGSWHTDYRDTAFINIGGLPFELSEGDIITIFSQYGEPVWVKLARDKETGKSRGFAWIKYEDQRSCDLAVDNLGGATIMDRVLRVDHARYKPRDDEDMRDNTMGELDLDPGNESEEGRRKRRKTDSDSESDEDRPLLPEEIELERLMETLDEDDPMRDSMIKRQKEKVDEALRKLKKAKRKEKERARRREKHHRRDGSRDRHRDKDKKRIKDPEDDDRRERHARPRDGRKNRHDDSDGERRHGKSSRRDDPSVERHGRYRDRSRDQRNGHADGRERDRRRSASDEEGESRPRSKRSPLPYRARSPRSRRDEGRDS